MYDTVHAYSRGTMKISFTKTMPTESGLYLIDHEEVKHGCESPDLGNGETCYLIYLDLEGDEPKINLMDGDAISSVHPSALAPIVWSEKLEIAMPK